MGAGATLLSLTSVQAAADSPVNENPPAEDDRVLNTVVDDGAPKRPSTTTQIPFDSEDYKNTLNYSKINRNTIVSSPSNEGSALEVVIPEGKHCGSNMHYDFGQWDGPLPEEAYSRHYVYFGNDFHVETSGKQPGFAHLRGEGGTGGGSLADGMNGWSARSAFYRPKSDGDLHLGTCLYHAEMDGPYGDAHLWNNHGELNTGNWYRIDQYVKMNTPGKNNAISRAWVDGNLAFDKQDIKFRDEGYDNLRVGDFWMHTYYGGNPTPDYDISVYYDNVSLSDSRIDNSIEHPTPR